MNISNKFVPLIDMQKVGDQVKKNGGLNKSREMRQWRFAVERDGTADLTSSEILS